MFTTTFDVFMDKGTVQQMKKVLSCSSEILKIMFMHMKSLKSGRVDPITRRSEKLDSRLGWEIKCKFQLQESSTGFI